MIVTRVTAVSVSLLLPNNWYFIAIHNFFTLSHNTHTRGHLPIIYVTSTLLVLTRVINDLNNFTTG